jgi:hypothetical protein
MVQTQVSDSISIHTSKILQNHQEQLAIKARQENSI